MGRGDLFRKALVRIDHISKLKFSKLTDALKVKLSSSAQADQCEAKVIHDDRFSRSGPLCHPIATEKPRAEAFLKSLRVKDSRVWKAQSLDLALRLDIQDDPSR